MKLFLQFGHGMMDHSKSLVKKWKSGTVILSPRDLDDNQLLNLTDKIKDLDGEVLLDPQCFAHDADHHRLTKHNYWKVYQSQKTMAFVDGSATGIFLAELGVLARKLGLSRHILPGLLAKEIDEDWFHFHEHIIKAAPKYLSGSHLATIALSSEVMLREDDMEEIVERAEQWEVDGFYIVPEIPAPYLVDNPIWLSNLLILASGLKLLAKTVIVGYCSHQMLCLASANVDAIASGTWLNVRAFQPDKFYTPDADDVSRRAKWYYCPQALSEYKIPFLDVAKQMMMLDTMRAEATFGSSFADVLFAGATPSSVDWNERYAFRHYLTCLHAQVGTARKASFDETYDSYKKHLEAARSFLKKLHARGIRGADRDFLDYIDVNDAAMNVFRKARGLRLKRKW